VVVSGPVFSGWQTGNVTLLLAVALALLWRYRDRPVVAGLLAALLISVKPIALPVGLWLLATRRFRAVAYGLVYGLAMNALAWGIVGFAGIKSWIHLLSVQGNVLYAKGYGVIAMAAHFGFGRGFGTGATVLGAAVLAAACFKLGWDRRDSASFALAVLLMIVVSPQVDSHYFALLLVPLAISHPRLDRAWVLPLLVWVCPPAYAATWQAVLWWLVAGAVVWAILRRSPRLRQGRTALADHAFVPVPTGGG
jgi:hypothetical protein